MREPRRPNAIEASDIFSLILVFRIGSMLRCIKLTSIDIKVEIGENASKSAIQWSKKRFSIMIQLRILLTVTVFGWSVCLFVRVFLSLQSDRGTKSNYIFQFHFSLQKKLKTNEEKNKTNQNILSFVCIVYRECANYMWTKHKICVSYKCAYAFSLSLIHFLCLRLICVLKFLVLTHSPERTDIVLQKSKIKNAQIKANCLQ